MTPDDLETRIIDLLEGSCEGEELRRLEQELASNPRARGLYRSHVRISAMLALHAEDEGNAVHQVIPMDLLMARQKRKVLRITALATAAAMLVIGSVLMLIGPPSPPPGNFVTAPGSQFTLTHSDAGDKTPLADNVLHIGSRLELHRGTVEIQLESGVRGILRAPAELTLTGEERVDLGRAVAWFTVPSEAIGFKVSTEEFLVTDLGTTFGVISNPSAADEVHVFDGLVEIERYAADSAAIRLKAGEARICSAAGGWEHLTATPSAFLVDLPGTLPPPPYIHFGFDGDSGNSFYADGTSPAVQEIVAVRGFAGEGPVRTEGVHGLSLTFDKERDYLATEWRGIAGNQPRSVAMWLKVPNQVEGPEYNSTLVTWGKQQGGLHNASWALRASTRNEEVERPGQPAIAERTLFQVRLGITWINATTDLADGRWHHVAAIYGGNENLRGEPEIHLYVDGVREPTHIHHYTRKEGVIPPALQTDVTSEDSNPLLIGRSKTRPEASCDAQIDELYIFEGEISSSLVQQLANAKRGWRP